MRDYPYILRFYYRLFGFRLGIVLFLALIAVVFDVISVTLFLPLLQGLDTDDLITRTMKPIIDLVPFGNDLVHILVIMVLTVTARSVFKIGQTVYTARLSNYLLADVRHRFVTRYFASDYRYMMSKDIGWINNALTVEFQRVVLGFEQTVIVLAGLFITSVYLIVPLLLSPFLVIIFVAFLLPGYFLVAWVNQKTREYSIVHTENAGYFQGSLIQGIALQKYLKATATASPVLGQIRNFTKRMAFYNYRMSLLGQITGNGVTPLLIGIIAIALYIQVDVYDAGLIESVFVLFLLKRAMDQLLGVQNAYRKSLIGIGSIKVFDRFDQELNENREPAKANGGSPNLDADLTLNGLGYAYDSHRQVLSDLTLTIRPNTMVAFVGESGSGKSTLAMLLTSTLRPTSGQILLGGVPYGDLDLEALRSSIGFVTQENVMFNDSVRDNISLWSSEIDLSTVKDAADKAAASEMIEALSDQYESNLGDNGVRLSGGQRQRVAIARELAKKPQLLILDEATSALDSVTERRIQATIERMKGEATIVLIAHRLSTVAAADVIYVLSAGRLVESGTFAELLDAEGEFSRLASEQGLVAGRTAARSRGDGR